MKKSISILLTLAILFVLSACGGGGATASPGTTATPVESAAAAPEESATATPEATQTTGAFTIYTVGDCYTIEVPNDIGLKVCEDDYDPLSVFIDIDNEGLWDMQIADRHDLTKGYDWQVDIKNNSVYSGNEHLFEPFSFGAHSGYLMHHAEYDFISVVFPYGNMTGENEPFGIIQISPKGWKKGDDITHLLSDPIIKAIMESVTLV